MLRTTLIAAALLVLGGFPAAADPVGARVEVNGMQMYYEVSGAGTGDADWTTLEHSVALFKLLGGGIMGDMGKPLAASRLAILPATAHTAVITQTDMLLAFVEPFLKGETPKGMFE